jgi:hypothetical protein
LVTVGLQKPIAFAVIGAPWAIVAPVVAMPIGPRVLGVSLVGLIIGIGDHLLSLPHGFSSLLAGLIGAITQAGYRVLAGSLPEKLAYLKAAEEGKALTETRFPTLNERAAQLVQGVIDLATTLEAGEAA